MKKMYVHTNADAMKLGIRARYYAERAHLSNAEIADRLDIYPDAISRMWLGGGLIGGVRIAKICKALECTPNELLGWEDDK